MSPAKRKPANATDRKLSRLLEGSAGHDVALVQALLLTQGHFISTEELRSARFGATTAEAVVSWKRDHGKDPLPVLEGADRETLVNEGRQVERTVAGTVSLKDGTPVADVLVTAFDRDFRARQGLGSETTDQSGRYRIAYTSEAFRRNEKGAADLGLTVTAKDGTEVFTTPVTGLLMQAPVDARIDVVVQVAAGAVPSDFEMIQRAIAPLVDGTPFGSLARDGEPDEVALLARESDVEPGRLVHFVVAHRVADESGLPAAPFYALLREDGLFGVGPDRPRVNQVPVTLQTEPRAVLYEAALLAPEARAAAIKRAVEKRRVDFTVGRDWPKTDKRMSAFRGDAEAYLRIDVPKRVFGLVEDLIDQGAAADLARFGETIDLDDLTTLYDRLDASGFFGAGARQPAATRLRLAELLGFNTGLVDQVSRSLGVATESDVRDLARLDRKDWTKLLSGRASKVTLGGRQIDAADARRQSSVIVRRFERAYPTTAFSAQLARRKPAAAQRDGDIAGFLDAHPDLELDKHRVVPFLREAGEDLAGVDPKLMGGVQRIQRLFQLTDGHYTTAEALLSAGYGSAAQVVAAGRKPFIAELARGAALTKGEAYAVFDRAENLNLASLLVGANLRTLSGSLPMDGPLMGADGGADLSKHIERIVAEQPDLASLFGSTDVCACTECRSIYGPAAYLADVMRFLRNRLVHDTTLPPGPATKTAKDVLFERRPDIGEIDLNCDNAMIPVPHIDLVCELLEDAIAPDQGFVFAGAVAEGAPSPSLVAAAKKIGVDLLPTATVYGPYTPGRFVLRDTGATIAVDAAGPNWKIRRLHQTHGSEAERAASPEYVNADAYDLVMLGKAAFGLPFDLFHAETGAFLKAAGIDRAALMSALASGGAPTDAAIAGEQLGLSAAQRALIFAADVAGQATIWATPSANASGDMANLDLFNRRTGLEYDAIEDLIAGPYVRGAQDLFIRHLDNSCDLAAKEIENLDDAALDRIHRVLRLARSTGLAPRDVDRLALGSKLGGGDLGAQALAALATVSGLATGLSVTVGQLLTWLDVIPTRGDPSDHALLFENPAATGPLSDHLSVAGIRKNEADEAATPGSGVRIGAVAADLALALGAPTSSVETILERLADPGLFGANPALTSATVGAVNGRLGLSRALGLNPVDLVRIERLASIDPLAGASQLRVVSSAARRAAATGVPLSDLEYLLARPASDPDRDLADTAATAFLDGLRKALLSAADAHQSPFDAALAPTEQVTALEGMLQQRPGLDASSVAAVSALIRLDTPSAADATRAKIVLDGSFADLSSLPAIKVAIDALVAAPSDATRGAVLKALMDAISATALAAATREAADNAVAALLGGSATDAAAILDGAQLHVGGVATPVRGMVIGGDVADRTVVIGPGTTPDLYRAADLVRAVSRLLEPFAPADETLAFVWENATALGWLRPDGVRFEAAAPIVPLTAWLGLADAFLLLGTRQPVAVPGKPGSTVGAEDILKTVLAGAAKADLLDGIAIVTGWPRDLVGDADTRLGLTVGDYGDPATWTRVGRLVDFLHLLGVPMAEAVAFSADQLGDTDRRNARRMLRARYEAADWLPALKAIMDPIREQKRDGLVAYLLAANPGLTTPDLFDHFLTDPLWSARMPSSRTVHAHGTLQLFIHRCIAGLEPKATAALDEDPDWSWWEWMSHYRVWQVPRKVFLYAEDYLQPQWRDDKTESFEIFGSDIDQNEVTEDNVGAAYEGYLERLDDTAFLDVLATCYDLDGSNLHVFGATKGGDPRVYYHRVMQRERSWTPWRKIDLDITGEHLVPFFRNGRLYLAWATFMEKGNDQQNSDFPSPSSGSNQQVPQAEKRQEIKLAISEFTGKRWRPRRVSRDAITTDWETEPIDLGRIHLTVNGGLRFTIDVWYDNRPGMYALGSFLLTGCKGYPEVVDPASGWVQLLPIFKDTDFEAQRLLELDQDSDDELAVLNLSAGVNFQTLFGRTPGTFRVTYPYQASEIDLLLDALLALWMRSQQGTYATVGREMARPIVFGTLMPYFFEDNQRGYILVPGFYGPIDDRRGIQRTTKTFSDVRRLFLDIVALAVKYLQSLARAATPADKQAVIDQLAADPEYARILSEIEIYRHLRFGTVVYNFYHPLACFLREQFVQGGLSAMLSRPSQLHEGPFVFESPTSGHAPSPLILPPYPRETLEFDRIHAYSDVNWELTYHALHFASRKLMEAGDFDAADKLTGLVFNPLGSSNDPAPQRYWQTKPFYLRTPAEYGEQMITAIADRLARDPGGVIETELADAVLDWRRNPLKPYLVARSRPVAFQQAIVHLKAQIYMARGNASFRREQLEDVTLAGLDYSRVERLLGPRPRVVPPAVDVPPETYNQLEAKLDLFGNALVTIENLLPDLSVLPHGGAELPPPPLTLESLYFCIPPSEKLFELWDELEQNQFNLRNSRTIDGVERNLSLFAPPLSVEAMIAAAAAGLSISQIFAGMSAPRPPYRFRVMLRQALEAAELAASFSRSFDQAISAGDTEGLSRLKNSQEIELLKQQTAALDKEIEAATRTFENAQKARDLHAESQRFFANRPSMNEWEIGAAAAYGASFALQAVMAVGYIAAGGLSIIPEFMVGAAGFGGSPTANASIGGHSISSMARDTMVGAISAMSGALEKAGSMLEHQGTYAVRKADWEHTASVEAREVERAEIEIKIADIRKSIATEQRRVHTVRQQQASAEETYLKTKFTNTELRDWQVNSLRNLSKMAYNVGLEEARAAERCYNFGAGTTDSFIRPGQWLDTRRGLHAADNLLLDLRKMEATWLKTNVREREISQDISMARLDPMALLELRTTGKCTFVVPEAFYDLDHPGLYFRRIKALSVTIPSIVGPASSVPLKVTQISNRVRVSTVPKSGGATDLDKYREDPGNDARFSYNVGSIESIETSHARDDSGLFALNLDDERYLPFEGSGACGTFVCEFPPTIRPFDYATITNVVFHVKYTARDGGGSFRTMVANAVRELLNGMAHNAGRIGLMETIDIRRDRPDQWQQLVSKGATELLLTTEDLPYFASQRVASITACRVLGKVAGTPASFAANVGGTAVTLKPVAEPDLAGLHGSSVNPIALGTPVPITITLPTKLRELTFVVAYDMTATVAP